MDFSELKRIPLGDVAATIIEEGGAVIGGLAAAGVAGRQVENIIMGMTPVTPTSTTMDKVKAYVANNAPKVILYQLLRGKAGVYEDARKGAVASVAFDTLMRLTNNGVNPASATIMGYQVLGQENGMVSADAGTVQRLIQENGMLLNRLKQLEGAMDPRLPPYVGSGAISPAERERRYAFMQPAIPGKAGLPPGAAARQTRYGFAGETVVMGVGRPGAAHVQAGKMFNMK